MPLLHFARNLEIPYFLAPYMKKHKEITPAQLMNMPITIGDLKKR